MIAMMIAIALATATATVPAILAISEREALAAVNKGVCSVANGRLRKKASLGD